MHLSVTLVVDLEREAYPRDVLKVLSALIGIKNDNEVFRCPQLGGTLT